MESKAPDAIVRVRRLSPRHRGRPQRHDHQLPRLRHRLEMRGHHFSTGNDSEVIAIYIADRLQSGDSLEEALRASVDDLDGSFAYLISTGRGIGLARDQFATKPLLYAETDELVVLSSEECAVRKVFPAPSLVPRELQAREVRWWLR